MLTSARFWICKFLTWVKSLLHPEKCWCQRQKLLQWDDINLVRSGWKPKKPKKILINWIWINQSVNLGYAHVADWFSPEDAEVNARDIYNGESFSSPDFARLEERMRDRAIGLSGKRGGQRILINWIWTNQSVNLGRTRLDESRIKQFNNLNYIGLYEAAGSGK